MTYFSEDIPGILLFREDCQPISPIQPLIEYEDQELNLRRDTSNESNLRRDESNESNLRRDESNSRRDESNESNLRRDESNLSEMLPPGFSFVSSSYSDVDNKHNVVHFGEGVLKCHVNEGKFLYCTVDFSKDSVEVKRKKEQSEKLVDKISTSEINFTDSSCQCNLPEEKDLIIDVKVQKHNSDPEVKMKEQSEKSVDKISTPEIDFTNSSCQCNLPEEKKLIMDVEEQKHNSDPERIYKNCVYRNDIKPVESSEKNNNSVKNKKVKSKKFISSESQRNTGSEEPALVVHPIVVVLEEIKKMKIKGIKSNKSQYKFHAQSLINVFTDPTSSPNTKTVLFHSLKHLSLSKLNPLLSFMIKKDYSVFCPMYEKTLIEAFIKVDDKKEIHLEKLVDLAIKNLNYLILDKKSISKTGLAAFCRIYANLCRVIKNMKPLKLCSDLLKRNHPFATFLIYNIVGAWKELFIPKLQPKEYGVLFHSVVAYGVQKILRRLTSNEGKIYNNLFLDLMIAPAIGNPVKTVEMALKNLEKLLNEKPTENDFLYVEPIVLLSTIEGAQWAWENVVKNFVLPSLLKFAQKTENERAFSILLEVYAEIGFYVHEDEVGAMGALLKFFNMKNGFSYVKPTSAVFLAKLAIFKRVNLFPEVKEWIMENENNLSGSGLEALLKCQLISDEPSFTENDIIF